MSWSTVTINHQIKQQDISKSEKTPQHKNQINPTTCPQSIPRTALPGRRRHKPPRRVWSDRGVILSDNTSRGRASHIKGKERAVERRRTLDDKEQLRTCVIFY